MSAVKKYCAEWFTAVLVIVIVISAPVFGYTNQWAAHIEGGPDIAKQVASDHGFRYLDKIVDDWYHLEHRSVSKRSTEPHVEVHSRLLGDSRVRRAEQQQAKSRTKRDLIVKRGSAVLQSVLNDERWSSMWYLNRGHGLDMNVQGAWAEGITGTGIVVTILDDGLEKDHPDLYKNYDPQASYDVNSHDEDPMPRYDLVDSNRHGTRCAGEVAATANNSVCAVGVAYGAGVGGVRMLDGDVTDAVEARSLSLNPQHIHIYSASWGPDDDGKTVDGPGELATRAFVEGITRGREGRGSIFVWASGNGGRDHDNCNCDGYTNSIWTLSISSATENGLVPWYSEACSSTLATTYSSGSTGEKQVVTTDLHHHCTNSHTGTSASAPLAAGICALALEANVGLTWRDMQHIVVRTAKPANLRAPDWVVNGVGRNVSHSFGYGLMDATAMVRLARKWRTVPEQHKCEVSAPDIGRAIPAKSQITLALHVKECSGVNFLEHVQAKVSLTAARRGDLQIQLTSPQGTKSTLLAKRPHDVSKAGFNQWPFMSVHTWGERPHGVWKLEIHNEGRYLDTLDEWKLVLYGTQTSPDEDDLVKENPITGVDVDQVHTNVVDTEGNPWTGSQRVDQASHPEVEQTETEDQTSGGACTKFDGSQCLAIASGPSPSGTNTTTCDGCSEKKPLSCHCRPSGEAPSVSQSVDTSALFAELEAFVRKEVVSVKDEVADLKRLIRNLNNDVESLKSTIDAMPLDSVHCDSKVLSLSSKYLSLEFAQAGMANQVNKLSDQLARIIQHESTTGFNPMHEAGDIKAEVNKSQVGTASVMLFGLSEYSVVDPQAQRAADHKAISSVLRSMVPTLHMNNVHFSRVGNFSRHSTSPRPVKITLPSALEASMVLRSSNQLRKSYAYKNLRISPEKNTPPIRKHQKAKSELYAGKARKAADWSGRTLPLENSAESEMEGPPRF